MRAWLLLCSLSALSVVVLSRPAEANERRFATLAPEGSLWMKQMRKGAAAVEKATDGRIRTRYYAGGVQGDEKDVVRKMRLGHLDGAALTSIGLGLIYPGIRVLQLPGLYDSLEELDYVRARMWPHFQEKFREQGFELLAPGDVGWVYVFSTRPLTDLASLRRSRVWIWDGDPMSSQVFKALGLRGVPLGVPEVLPALNTGKVETVFNSPYGAIALQWHTRIRYISSVPVGYGIGGMVMVKDVWEGASEEDRKTQREIGLRTARETIRRVRRDNRRAVETLTRYGVKVTPTPPAVESELTAQARTLWQTWTGSVYSKEELDMVLRHRDEYRKKHAGKKGDSGRL
jgi:TRAP-type transport system periplasmic protein